MKLLYLGLPHALQKGINRLKIRVKYAFALIVFTIFSSANAEQSASGMIEKVDVVNYNDGAAYVYIENASFDECPNPTTWCAIDFSLPAANQMYSAVLAAKFAGKKIGITTNGCWSGGQYARCWKVHIRD
ncbi:hypothetical protein P886_2192 [Alteromonadaceae bacterium 2753L.S.0a.02]|nr:hypothetical protein P886_2192 [Alteromonadaceae bacterium 2753L.S.0a.02]